MRVAKKGKGFGKTPARGTFTMGAEGSNKVPIGGTIRKGTDLRSGSGKNQGKMPKSM